MAIRIFSKLYPSIRCSSSSWGFIRWRENLKRNYSKLLPITSKNNIQNGPGLREFLVAGKNIPAPSKVDIDKIPPYLDHIDLNGNQRKVYFEVYGCQMNVNDTEIVWAILQKADYVKVADIKDADIVMIITCAIREGAETKIWNRLKHISAIKRNRSHKKGPFQVALLGCMAERLKTQILEKEQWVDIVAGPDSYKDLPRLLAITKNNGQSAANVLLSLDETYADIMPVRLNEGSINAFVSIMRGCDNMCSYCIVPFTRGRERSRPMSSIENEVKLLAQQGIKEITLLGQNVNSYRDLSSQPSAISDNSSIVSGFKTVYKPKIGGTRFADLLEVIANAAPGVRIRFTSPHPKDFPDEVLKVMQKYPNICKSIHLPAQSGNSSVLDRMRRGYTREAYLELVENIRNILPNVAFSSDFICGFCGETDDEFADTISLIKLVNYHVAYLFAYSMREKTTAHRRYTDDISDEIKQIRLREMITAYRDEATKLNSQFIGSNETILIEGVSKRSNLELYGRNEANIKVIIEDGTIPIDETTVENRKPINPGDFVCVRIEESNSQVLKGKALWHTLIN